SRGDRLGPAGAAAIGRIVLRIDANVDIGAGALAVRGARIARGGTRGAGVSGAAPALTSKPAAAGGLCAEDVRGVGTGCVNPGIDGRGVDDRAPRTVGLVAAGAAQVLRAPTPRLSAG